MDRHPLAETSFQNLLQDVNSKPLKRLQSNPCRQMGDNTPVAMVSCDSRGEITPSPFSLKRDILEEVTIPAVAPLCVGSNPSADVTAGGNMCMCIRLKV